MKVPTAYSGIPVHKKASWLVQSSGQKPARWGSLDSLPEIARSFCKVSSSHPWCHRIHGFPSLLARALRLQTWHLTIRHLKKRWQPAWWTAIGPTVPSRNRSGRWRTPRRQDSRKGLWRGQVDGVSLHVLPPPPPHETLLVEVQSKSPEFLALLCQLRHKVVPEGCHFCQGAEVVKCFQDDIPS